MRENRKKNGDVSTKLLIYQLRQNFVPDQSLDNFLISSYLIENQFIWIFIHINENIRNDRKNAAKIRDVSLKLQLSQLQIAIEY